MDIQRSSSSEFREGDCIYSVHEYTLPLLQDVLYPASYCPGSKLL